MFKFLQSERGTASKLICLRDSLLGRILFWEKCVSHIRNLNGAIVECGVGTGVGLCVWSTLLLRAEGKESLRQIIALDSFEGFSSFNELDGKYINEAQYKKNYKQYNLQYIYSVLEEFGLCKDFINKRIQLKRGYVPDVLNQIDDNLKISILNLDFDIYEPIKHAFLFFYDKVETGGIILFDEYDKPQDLLKWPGSKVAIDESLSFLGIDRKKIKYDKYTGRSYLVKD